MIAIIGPVISLLFWGLKLFMKNKVQDEEFYNSYLNFLDEASRKGYIRVQRLQEGEESLIKLQFRIKKRLDQLEKAKNQKDHPNGN